MKTALVLGVNGQDGSYLAEVLIERGYDVTGVARQPVSRGIDPKRFRYQSLDVAEAAPLDALLAELRPDEIYHMAAVHGSAGYAYEAGWRAALAVNVGCIHTCLEHMRMRSQNARLFYPSSIKAFGAHPPQQISEATPRVSDCLYSLMKNTATDLIHYYRVRHGVFACVGYYFNHDSPRRPDSYFLPRLAARIAGQIKQQDNSPDIVSLDFWCDWGSSREFAEMTADLLQAEAPEDVIMATGQSVYAARLAAELASAAGLVGDIAPPASSEAPFRADLTKLRTVVGRIPHLHAFDVAAWILRERHGIVLPKTGAVS